MLIVEPLYNLFITIAKLLWRELSALAYVWWLSLQLIWHAMF